MLSINFSMFVHSVALNAAVFPVIGIVARPGPKTFKMTMIISYFTQLYGF